MAENIIIIIVAVITVVVLTLISFGIHKLVRMGTDSIRNSIVEKQEKRNPPRQENLADKFQHNPYQNRPYQNRPYQNRPYQQNPYQNNTYR